MAVEHAGTTNHARPLSVYITHVIEHEVVVLARAVSSDIRMILSPWALRHDVILETTPRDPRRDTRRSSRGRRSGFRDLEDSRLPFSAARARPGRRSTSWASCASRAEADGPCSAALITLLACNGLHVDEALSRNVEHLGHQLGHRVLRISRKGGRDALEPLSPPVKRALDAYLGDRASGALFVNDRGRRTYEAQAWRLARRLARNAGLRPT
jgi:integrase